MKRFYLLVGLCTVALLLVIAPVSAQTSGVTITCPNGQVIENGVEIIVNMRPGFTYTATALGIDGFDPVLGVSDQTGVSLCTDDDPNAITYSAQLPTTGFVGSSNLNSQVPFSHSFNDFADISIVVGGFNGQSGEFILVLEGMAVTSADGSGPGAGDPFSVRLTENLVNSETPLSVYMISTTSTLDPYFSLVDTNGNPQTDDTGVQVICDDAGNVSLCWGQSQDLSGSYVSQRSGNQLPGFEFDAMLTLPLDEFRDLDMQNNFYALDFLMTSYQQTSTGEYLVAFHMETTDTAAGPTPKDDRSETVPETSPSNPQTNIPSDVPMGVTATCPNGQVIENGVEVIVNMRPGFTYTATALGVNGFDPVLAVSDQTGVSLCTDDDPNAVTYTAQLPSTGFVGSSNLNSQVPFSHSFNDFADISIVTGGFGGTTGEFVLILEGMAVTSADGSGPGAGDPFTVNLTPNIVASGVPISVYMISTTTTLDPLVQMVDVNGNPLLDIGNNAIVCDDAGNPGLCWGQSQDLSSSYVSQRSGNRLPGFERDAMISLPPEFFEGLDYSGGSSYFGNFLMTSFQQSSTGEYLVAMHFGTTDSPVGSFNAKR